MGSLSSKNALVTGSTSGIGLAIARAFAAEGANVTINGLGDAAAIEQERAGIEKASALAAVARDESTNMMAADVGRRIFKVPRIVVRIDEPRMAELYRREGFEVISPIVEGTLALERALAKRTET